MVSQDHGRKGKFRKRKQCSCGMEDRVRYETLDSLSRTVVSRTRLDTAKNEFVWNATRRVERAVNSRENHKVRRNEKRIGTFI
mmetsp:Transcript_31163/g.47739  ORF Transcript_31163/g.47739 Transcript_31163/m.47739 type:complete len:83 (-) Transcript_31163:298-546(-)